ncbi:MAG TPA: phosphoserine phosphatase SerB [Microbacteriaceae bacterium]
MKISVLVVFDVDSTLIAHEAIEEIADVLGKRELVREITDAAMRGEIDFEQSLKQRVSLLEGVRESDLLEISEKFIVNDGAAELIDHVHSLGGKACAVSGGFASLLKPIASQLKLDAYLANHLEILKGVLTGGLIPPIIDAEAKRSALLNWAERFSIPMEKTVAIGDGANDLLMMEAAAVSIGFVPKPIVAKSCDHILETADFRPVIDLLP